MLILHGDVMYSFQPKSNKHECITNNQLPAMFIRGIILGFKSKPFSISLPEALTHVIKVELRRDIWLNLPWSQFKVVQFIWKCIGTLSLCYCTTQNCRQHPIAVCTNLVPNIYPFKPNLSLTAQSGELSKYSELSLTSFSVFEF